LIAPVLVFLSIGLCVVDGVVPVSALGVELIHHETAHQSTHVVRFASALSQSVLFWNTHPGAGGILVAKVKN